ncbi:ABC-2 type transport system permease protein [Kitasatospora sp. MAP12-15]|uniref:ABC transporter permease n=1 Tax=unclassified Kitasatospora TaxID=2633591 RepID=UPI002476E1B7|nr:ABC transporter permease [Kitasatospora sp. MAP12-44]MDH6114508.1 ABC-2 type transport system permease protein [Kitasatospora sp. MAP12-44]
MNGVWALARLEILRVFRNRRVLFFSVLYPTLLFVVIGGSAKGTIGDVPVRNYYMVAMALFGALGAALMNNAQKIAQERSDGWIKQLKLTTLPGNGYVVAKIASAAMVTLPAIVVVFVVGGVMGVHLSAAVWVEATLIIWFASFAFTALGIAIGYAIPQDSVQLISMITYFVMAILGGLWFTLGSGALADVGKVLPSYSARDYVMHRVSGLDGNATDLVVIALWVVGAIAFAGYVYQRDAKIDE